MNSSIALFVQSVVVCAISYFLWIYVTSPVKSFPGPILAKFTNVWRLLDALRGHPELTQQRLHKRYGKYVCIGPNFLSISDPAMIQEVYSYRSPLPKSSFYSVADIVANGQVIPSQFSMIDEPLHTKTMRPINKLFSLNSTVEYEPLMDETTHIMLKQLDDRFVGKGPCSMDNWLNYYSWDVISAITFSKRLGFLESGTDVSGFIDKGSKGGDYFAVIGQMPFLDKILDKNPIHRVGPPSFGRLAQFAADQVFTRLSGATSGNDFLNRYIKTKETDPDVVTNDLLVAYVGINVFAGSDTIAIALRSAMYYILRNPDVQSRLRKELNSVGLSVPARWSEVQGLPYLDAVIKESMRIHPSIALPLQRVVQEGGLTLPDGAYLPKGTIVANHWLKGINPAVIHHDEDTFGDKVDEFTPDRWLKSSSESDESYERRLHAMNKANMTFGHGPRNCLGRHVAILEVYKLIATLFTVYDVKLVDPSREWKTRNGFFHRQWDMDVYLQRRD